MLGDLIIPRSCAGCQRPGEVLCARCRLELRQPPTRVSLRVDPGVPVFSLGAYSQLRQRLIVAMKEHSNRAVRPLLGAVIGAGITTLIARGELSHNPVLVPAPTRARRARLRGGDHVLALCQDSGFPHVALLHYGKDVRDQVGLDAQSRRRNLVGKVRINPRARVVLPGAGVPLVLVDDVATTGATLEASVEKLIVSGCSVLGALCFSHA